MRNGRSNAVTAVVAATALALATGGCQSSSRPLRRPSAAAVSDLPSNASIDDALGTDPRAARLNDIAGALLVYYSSNKQLPTHLADVTTIDPSISPTDPTSGQPYGYAPEGLASPGRQHTIIVYEPTAAADGKRWCIVTADTHPGQSLSLDILPLPEPVFLGYTPPR